MEHTFQLGDTKLRSKHISKEKICSLSGGDKCSEG